MSSTARWLPPVLAALVGLTSTACGSEAESPVDDTHEAELDTATKDTHAAPDTATIDQDTAVAPDTPVGDTEPGDIADADTESVDVIDADAVLEDTADADVGDGPQGEACGTGLPDCPAERPWCEPIYKVCVECLVAWRSELSGGCGTTAYCGDDWTCHDATRCMLDADCVDAAQGPRCNPLTYFCAQCGTDLHCAADERCLDGACVPATPCVNGGDCEAPNGFCDAVTKRCVGCNVSRYLEDCLGQDALCVDRQCVPVLRAEDTACTTDADCRALGVGCRTVAGHCRPCTDDAECPSERWCNLETGACERDVCAGGATRCVLPCWAPHETPGRYPCTPPAGIGAIEECNANGSGWKLWNACGADTLCVYLGEGHSASCEHWATCEAGEAWCDGYTSQVTCDADGYLQWSSCPTPKLCGASGQCENPP